MAQTVTESIELASRNPNEDAASITPSSNVDIQPESQAAEDESQYPTGTRFYLIFFSVCVVLVLSEMESSIVSVAVPAITNHFHTVADIGWYSSAYRLSMCSFQFMFGKMYKIFPFKPVFLGSVGIFLVGATICSVAPSSLAFVVGRAVSGLSCAGIVAGCFALLVRILPLRKRPLYTGIAAAVEGISVITAPVVGGVLVQVNWRWCFIINIPAGAAALVFLAFFMEDWKPAEKLTWRRCLQELDLVGNLVLVPALTSLFMALGWAGTKYSWNSPTIIALFCVFVVLLAVFALDQWIKQDSATLPPRVLKNRSVIAGFIYSMCCNSTLHVVLFYLPTVSTSPSHSSLCDRDANVEKWFQAVKEFGPAKSGYLMIPAVIGNLVAFLLQGAGVSVIGYYAPFMLAGSILMPIFAGLMTTLSISTSLVKVSAFMVFLGFAGGIGFQSPQSAVQAALPAADANIGLAIIIFAQNFGPAIFVMAAQTIFTNRLSANLQHLAPALSGTSIENMGLSDLKGHLGPTALHDVLLGLDQSLSQTWYLAVGLACTTIIGSASMEWKSVKQKRS